MSIKLTCEIAISNCKNEQKFELNKLVFVHSGNFKLINSHWKSLIVHLKKLSYKLTICEVTISYYKNEPNELNPKIS